MAAYACVISEENLGAIASEHPKFDLEETRRWMGEHELGFFVRDEDSLAFDCRYMDVEVFKQIYQFDRGNSGDLFRRCHRI